MALLPLENLTATADAGEIMTRIFWNELARSGAMEMVEPGDVEAAIDAMHIRATASLTSDQLRALGVSLSIRYVFAGSVLEHGKIPTGDGDVPTIGVTLRMVDAQSAQIVWTGSHFRSGDDRETVFGWGRVRSLDRLATDAVAEMLKEFREVGRETRPPIQAAGGSK